MPSCPHEQVHGPATPRAAMRTLLIVVKDPLQLPDDLPVPKDDGAADHLAGTAVPAVALWATDGASVRLDELEGRTVVFAYPRTGRPGEPSPGGDDEWNAIPGACGCTPQACSFRDEHARFAAAQTRVFGLSTQDTAYQQEAAERLHLPYPLLSDERLELATVLGSRPSRSTASRCSSASHCSCTTARSKASSTPSSHRTAAPSRLSPGSGSDGVEPHIRDSALLNQQRFASRSLTGTR